ncbi:MAG: hypothetical protein AAGA70_15490, partial [Pseudomonadota bacterium]
DPGATEPVTLRPRDPDFEELNSPVPFDDALYVTGLDGTILRLDPGATEPVTQLRDPDGDEFYPPVSFDGALYVTGWFGTVLRSLTADYAPVMDIDPRLGLPDPAPEAADMPDALSDTLDALIAEAEAAPPRLAALRRELDLINAERTALTVQLQSVTEALAAFDGGLWSLLTRADPALGFATFMRACREGHGEALDDPTAACLAAFSAEEAQSDTPWWEILARQVPPGVLLLFLLVTLGGLYRYNMRMSGFHHSRADLLELIAIGRDPGAALSKQDWIDIRETADALAADKVAFGATKAGVGPGGVNFEIARHLKTPE